MENKEILRLIYDLDTGNPSTYKIEQNKIKIIKDYIEQLEKENTRLKKKMTKRDNIIFATYDEFFCEDGISDLERNNILLKKQLQAKDKALDKAIKLRELVNDCPPECNCCLLYDKYYNGEEYACDVCWKEWCENEID